MKLAIITIFMVMLVSGCNKGATSPGAKPEQTVIVPGYEEARLICTQCHALPSPDQYHPAAWPSIVARMEGHMRANNRMLPDEKQRAAIIGYFQNSKW